MNRRTDSYAVSASMSSVRSATGRLASSIEVSFDRSGGVGRPGNRVLLLARHVERRARGHEGGQAGCVAQELRHDRTRVEDLLEVVEHEEDALVGEPLAEDHVGAARPGFGEPDRGRDSRRDQARLAHGLERDEEHAVRVAIGCVRGDLQGEPGLPGAAGPGQRHEAVGGQELPGFGELALPPDERRELRREVVRPGIERGQRREIHPQPVGDDLAERLRLPEVLQPVASETVQRDPAGETRGDERADRVRDDHLAAVRCCRDPGRAVDVQAHEARRRFRRLAGVEAHPNVDLDTFWPRLGGEGPLPLHGGHDRLDRAVEDDEERVALGRLLASAVVGEGCPQECRLSLEDRGVRRAAERFEQPGRALDVREQEGERRRRGGPVRRHQPAAVTTRGAGARPSVPRGVRDLAQASRDAAQDGERQGRLLEQDLVEIPRREGEAARRLLRRDRGVAGLPVEHRQLAEEVARTEPRDDLAVAHHANPAGDDDEEARPDLALAGDGVPRREVHRRGELREGREARGVDALEQRAPGEQLGSSIVRQGHPLLHPQLRARMLIADPVRVN